MEWKVGDLFTYNNYLMRVEKVKPASSNYQTYLWANFLNQEGWEWWYGDTYENIIEDNGGVEPELVDFSYVDMQHEVIKRYNTKKLEEYM